MINPGDRAGAIISADKETKIVQFAGYGVYVGDIVPPPGIGLFGLDFHDMGKTNPKIELDNGSVIWGCQCWWGHEEAVKKQIESYKQNGYDVVIVDPSVYSPVSKREDS